MSKKKDRNTKGKIIVAALKLFYELGYDNTTVEEIIEASGTSKGSFYHYFEGKDALLSSLSYLFDEKYEELMNDINPEMHAFDKLIYLNSELFGMIENGIAIDLLARLFSTQLITKGEKHLLDRNRTYYKVIREIVLDGQQKGELSAEFSVNEIVKAYAMLERAIMYDWCICNGEYSLKRYSMQMMPMLLAQYKIRNSELKFIPEL